MRSVRTIVSISEEEKRWLETYGSLSGISMAEAIRRGIRGLMEREKSVNYRAALDSTRGIWTEGDGLEYQDKQREEWGR